MARYTIDPTGHYRLRAFLAGKKVVRPSKTTTIELTDREAASLLRKAEQYGFEKCVKAVGEKAPPKAPEAPLKEPVKTEESEPAPRKYTKKSDA